MMHECALRRLRLLLRGVRCLRVLPCSPQAQRQQSQVPAHVSVYHGLRGVVEALATEEDAVLYFSEVSVLRCTHYGACMREPCTEQLDTRTQPCTYVGVPMWVLLVCSHVCISSCMHMK